ncbi:hypothetical protein os4_20660 [Comamonadaceae bacterium OS-4]|nr:hypothetical protein os4_20660 [Comamonadaceae bacterium OS-4]
MSGTFFSSSPNRRPNAGFTLLELIVVVAIIAVLASLAVPEFASIVAKANVSKAMNNFIADANFARGEALRQGKSVTMCRSNSPAAAVPVCSGGDGVAVGGWQEGWVVFIDDNGNGTFNAATDRVVRAQEALNGLSNFFAVGANTISAVATANALTFDGTGRAIGQQARWLIHPSGSLAGDTNFARTICMNSVGRTRWIKGESPC